MITINETALRHLEDIMKEEGITNETHFLRVGVKGGGYYFQK